MHNTYRPRGANPFSSATHHLKPTNNPLDELMIGVSDSEEQKRKRQVGYSPYMTNVSTGMHGNYEMPYHNPKVANFGAMNPYATGIPQVEF